MARKRIYTLYAHFHERTGRVTIQRRYDTSKPSIVQVRAHSIKQAYKLTGNRTRAENGGVGIVSIRN
jgi:hypothetical protein